MKELYEISIKPLLNVKTLLIALAIFSLIIWCSIIKMLSPTIPPKSFNLPTTTISTSTPEWSQNLITQGR